VGPGDEVVVDIPFSGYLGKFVFHCHVLEHEDDGMMTQFRTVRPPDDALPGGGSPGSTNDPADTLSRKIRILSSKRLRRILRRGLRFEAAVPVTGASLRATMSVRGRKVGHVRRKGLPRGRVKVTLKLSRREKVHLRRLMVRRRRVKALLKVTAGGETRRARFTIRR
jgi:hypothetical protein